MVAGRGGVGRRYLLCCGVAGRLVQTGSVAVVGSARQAGRLFV